jgi:hypothetical protein
MAFLSCNNKTTRPTAIKDFREPLQQHLAAIVSKGVVGWDTSTSYIDLHATDEELRSLSKCEHPVLRAIALDMMTHRPSFDHFAVIMNNLDDSAVVATDAGEWGVRYFSVSDNMVENARWKDTNSRKKTMEEIILYHHHLKSAYSSLSRIKRREAYYPIVRQMALQDTYATGEPQPLTLGAIDFETREMALIALARYEKQQDAPAIKEVLFVNASELSMSSFALMAAFPDTSYMEVYEKCLRSLYIRMTFHRIDEIAASFIASLAAQKNQKSAALLERMLQRKPFMPCSVDSSYIMSKLYNAVWENPCAAYVSLRKRAAPFIREEAARTFYLPPVDPIHFVDTAKEPVRWWSY